MKRGPDPLTNHLKESESSEERNTRRGHAGLQGETLLDRGPAHWRRWGFFFLTAPLAITSYHTNKTASPRHLLAPAAMITGPDRNRRHGIVSAMPRPSCRAAGGLRWPPES